MWSYDSTNLATDTLSGRLNSVRLLLGDTDTLDQQVQDEELLFALVQTNNNIYFAAAWAANTIASQYARKVDASIDGALNAKYYDLHKHYINLAKNLDAQGKKAGAVVGVVAGGMTISDINGVRGNTNRVEGSFRRDRFRNPPSYETPEYE